MEIIYKIDYVIKYVDNYVVYCVWVIIKQF